MKKYFLQVYRHTPLSQEEDTWVNVKNLDIHSDIIQILVDLGIVEIKQGHISAGNLRRVQKLMRLRSNLGVNLPGAAIILDLLDRLERLQYEVELLKRR